jgi:hypothetical protein
MTTEIGIAQEFVALITERSYAFDGLSPLTRRVQQLMQEMTSVIAAEVIEETPELAEVIRGKVRAAVRQALLDDTALNSIVTHAVAKALTDAALSSDD